MREVLRAALAANGVTDENIEVVADENEAIDAVPSRAPPGDLLALPNTFAISDSWTRMIQFRPRT